MHSITKKNIFCALLSGFLLTGSFPGIGISWLAWFALVPLLIALNTLSPMESFRIGVITGLVHYLSLMYWIAYTLKTYGQLSYYLGIPILFLFCAYLSLYPGVFSWMMARFAPKPFSALFTAPVFWVSLEYIRSHLLSGFPWELVGYTQYRILHLIQISDIVGVYGVSFAVLFCNATIVMLFLCIQKRKWQGVKVNKYLAAGAVSVFGAVFITIWFYGTWRINWIDRLASISPFSRIAIIQGNIDQAIKWDPRFQVATVDKYVGLSLQAKKEHPDLIVWPETATPFYFLYDIGLTKRLQKGIREAGTSFLFGSPSFKPDKNIVKYYNSAYLVNSDAEVLGRYDKAHLVPFGEYIPFKKWFPFLGKMIEQVGDFRSGKSGVTIDWGEYRLGMLICYEIIFPNLARKMVKNNASLLINITNDAWYGKTAAPYQHFSMAVFRAVENRRGMVRSANTGISGFIDPAGRIVSSTPLFKDAVMTRLIPHIDTETVYTRIGDAFAWLCLSGTLLITIYRIRR
ncbi:MAG: apolipoprotein N-acyltransferase [Desulfobacterales bacterium]